MKKVNWYAPWEEWEVHSGISLTFGLYLLWLSIVLLYTMLVFWPTVPEAGTPAAALEPVKFLFFKTNPSNEIRLILVVAAAGAFGSLLTVLREANGHWWWSVAWIVFDLIRPFMGAGIGLVFYLVIRGGFLSSTTSIDQTNPFALVALAIVGGLFAENAQTKLKDVAVSMFGPTGQPKAKETEAEEAETEEAETEEAETEEAEAEVPGAAAKEAAGSE